MADYVKVNTDDLAVMADSINTKVGVLTGKFDDIMSIVMNSVSYWQGDAADAFRKCFVKKHENVSEFLERLTEYVSDLGSIKNVYETTEKAIQDLSADLNTDVIY